MTTYTNTSVGQVTQVRAGVFTANLDLDENGKLPTVLVAGEDVPVGQPGSLAVKLSFAAKFPGTSVNEDDCRPGFVGRGLSRYHVQTQVSSPGRSVDDILDDGNGRRYRRIFGKDLRTAGSLFASVYLALLFGGDSLQRHEHQGHKGIDRILHGVFPLVFES